MERNRLLGQLEACEEAGRGDSAAIEHDLECCEDDIKKWDQMRSVLEMYAFLSASDYGNGGHQHSGYGSRRYCNGHTDYSNRHADYYNRHQGYGSGQQDYGNAPLQEMEYGSHHLPMECGDLFGSHATTYCGWSCGEELGEECLVKIRPC